MHKRMEETCATHAWPTVDLRKYVMPVLEIDTSPFQAHVSVPFIFCVIFAEETHLSCLRLVPPPTETRGPLARGAGHLKFPEPSCARKIGSSAHLARRFGARWF